MQNMKYYTYRIIIEPDGKFFHGYVPALPGCHTFGKTISETRKYVSDAISVYIKSLIDDKESIPEDRSFESFETVSFPISRVRTYA